ncbi:MAG: hypothetical protein ABIO29_08500 [Sphingomicrobium sp.]
MRALIAIPAIALLAACQVSKDEANDTVSMTYNQDVAENAAADVSATAQNVGSDIANGVDKAGDRIQNTDVNVSVDTNTQDNR